MIFPIFLREKSLLRSNLFCISGGKSTEDRDVTRAANSQVSEKLVKEFNFGNMKMWERCRKRCTEKLARN